MAHKKKWRFLKLEKYQPSMDIEKEAIFQLFSCSFSLMWQLNLKWYFNFVFLSLGNIKSTGKVREFLEGKSGNHSVSDFMLCDKTANQPKSYLDKRNIVFTLHVEIPEKSQYPLEKSWNFMIFMIIFSASRLGTERLYVAELG